MTVLEGIQKSADFLARKEVESPRLQAELLLARVLNLPRMQLYLSFERVLTQAEVNGLRDVVQRRGRREPLQHIAGSTSFCGLEITVNPFVLVPRPETELLAEAAWTFLSGVDSDTPRALDFGTGSGCIAVAMAVRCSRARCHAVDISADAIATARANAAQHGVESRIAFVEGDGFAGLPDGPLFNLVVSNPPYVPSAEIETLEPEVKDYDPRLALDGGPDGLDHFRRLAAEASRFLLPAGRLMLEFGDGQAGAVKQLLENQNWVVESVREDYSRRPRYLVANRPETEISTAAP